MLQQNSTQFTMFPEYERGDRILYYLRNLPHLQFSETGIFNICKRFGISAGELEEYIGVIMNEHGGGR